MRSLSRPDLRARLERVEILHRRMQMLAAPLGSPRPAMWNDKRVSVVLMTYAERDSIRSVIEGFFDTGVVDEVVVVDNNAQPGTREEVARTQARLVHESTQGYGHATRRGLVESSGDLIVIAEPDGTFRPEDIFKLLVYSEQCEAVFGTRTTRELIWSGANMAFFL